MAIVKVLGIETEFGVHAVGLGDSNPTNASSLLINAYVQGLSGRVGWDFEDESPGRDARGFVREGSMPPEVETHLVNTVLTNGARYYVDHTHPEYSSPECSNVLELLAHDRAGEVILERSMQAVQKMLPPGGEIIVHKNNSDGKGNSYGCHENYLLDRSVPFASIASEITSHLVTRQIFTGSGKVGCEEEGGPPGAFEITQRVDFFEEEIGLETTLKRPIINTRDEPHADPQKYRRLHVISGDATLCEVATLLKVGTTALLLSCIEDGFLAEHDLLLAMPVPSMHRVSHDVTLREPLELRSGRKLSALEIQWELFELADKYAAERGLESIGPEHVGRLVLDRWEAILAGLESDPSSCKTQLDWVAKYELIDAFCARHDCGPDDPRVHALDLQFHDLRRSKSLFRRLSTERLIDEETVESAVLNPPTTTRAYFRGECLKRFPGAIVAANWDSLVFDLGDDPLRRVPMMEPLRGTAAHVGTLLESCNSPAELLERLGG